MGLDHGDAWWLRDVKMRKVTEDALELASIHAVSRAIPARGVVTVEAMTPARAPTPHAQQSVSWNEGRTQSVANRLELTTQGVGSLAIDAARARLVTCGLRVQLRTDGPLTVHLLRRSAATETLRVPKMNGTLVVGCSR